MPREERPRERGDEQRERRAAQHEQQQMAQLLPAHRSIRNALQEHQRRKLDDDAALAVDQVDDHRNGDRGEAGEERGSEEIHLESYRTRLKFCRDARNANSARSSGFDVSNSA